VKPDPKISLRGKRKSDIARPALIGTHKYLKKIERKRKLFIRWYC